MVIVGFSPLSRGVVCVATARDGVITFRAAFQSPESGCGVCSPFLKFQVIYRVVVGFSPLSRGVVCVAYARSGAGRPACSFSPLSRGVVCVAQCARHCGHYLASFSPLSRGVVCVAGTSSLEGAWRS